MSNCIVITHPHPLNAPGGGTRSCLQIAEHLRQLGAEVILVPVSSEAPEELKEKPFQIVPASPSRIHFFLDSYSVTKTVKKILKEKQVDALLSWEHEAAFLPGLLKSNKVVFGMIAAHPSYTEWVNRQTKLRQFKRLTDKWFRWRLFKSADVVFVSSNFTQDELIKLFEIESERIKITHRGVDTFFSQVERSPSSTISNLIFYGSFAPPKGVFDAIEALGRVAAQGHKNWTLKLAGWGFEEEVKQAIRQHKIEEHVSFLGRLGPRELAQKLELAHLAILPSRIESFGRAIAEAQAAGLAVISYDSGSVPELVENGVTGWLVPTKRVDLLADAIIEAMQNPDKVFQMGMKGRDRVTEKFSWERTATAILEGIDKAKQQMQN